MVEPDPVPVAQVRRLGDEMVRLRRHRTTVHEGVLLEASAFRLLWALAGEGPSTLRQLADHLDLEQSTINRQANAAIAAGYLERYDVAGSASRLLRPTAAGQEAYEHDSVLRAARYQRVLAVLGPGRASSLIEHLTAFNDAWDAALSAEQAAGRPTDPPIDRGESHPPG